MYHFSYILTISILFFFFNDTATTEIYTLSLHDALPIYDLLAPRWKGKILIRDPLASGTMRAVWGMIIERGLRQTHDTRSEEHTSELQSQSNLVCRLLLEKKKKKKNKTASK